MKKVPFYTIKQNQICFLRAEAIPGKAHRKFNKDEMMTTVKTGTGVIVKKTKEYFEPLINELVFIQE